MNRTLQEVILLGTRQSFKVVPNRCEIAVEGPVVTVRQGNALRELPRVACQLIYRVDDEAPAKAKGAKKR